MCLTVNKKLCPNGYKIAKKNIPCYKMLLKRYDGTFETPFMRQLVDITAGIESDCFQTEPMSSNFLSYLLINGGIHSYIDLMSARRAQSIWFGGLNSYAYVGVTILKAYIPKGTKYWVGENHEFCSERIVFAKE